MTVPVHDLIVTVDGTDVGYYVYTKAETPIEIDLSQPELPSTTVIPENPGQDGSYYSVRDQNQPAILYTNWSNGAGQKTYEGDDTLSSRFHSSSYIDTQNKGELRLARSVSLADDTEVEGVTLNALGKVWMTFAPDAVSDPRDQLRYWSGTAWVPVPIDGADPTVGINCLATDGDYIYAAFAGTDGVYRVKDSDGDGVFSDETLASWAGAADADGIQAMVYSGGYMYAAKATAVGYFDATPTWQQINPTALSVSLTTFGLATAKNWVYWGTTADEVTRLYRCQYDGTDEWFEDVCSFPTGFIGTCMASYLGNVYVGGYYECATSSVGQGAVYLVTDGTPVLLATIGDNPDYSSVPSSTDNDNRVWAMEPSAKDLYVLTTRRVLRWDLDDGGYVHVCDVPQGTTSSFAWSTTGDLDYTAAAVPDSGTWTATGTASTAEVRSGTMHIQVATGYTKTYTATPAGGDALANATGTTMEVTLPAHPIGTISTYPVMGSGGEFGFDDGTYQTRVRLSNPYGSTTNYRISLGEWTGAAWDYTIYDTVSCSVARTLRLVCTGEYAALYVGDTLLRSVTSLEDTSSTNVFFRGGSDLTSGYIKYDSVYISNDGAFAPGSEYSSSTMGGLAVRDSKLYVGINSIGYVISDSTYETEGWLRQSESTSRSGSVAKRYHQIRISHDPLRTGEDIACDWYIDGVFYGGGTGTTTDTVTTFDVDESGGSIAPVITLTSDGSSTPIVRSVVVLFEFAKSAMHTYILDCRKGTESGRWSVDPETAIEHLISAGRYGGTFETHTDAAFKGVVQKLKYLKAQRSTRGGLEGIVQIVIREL